jgi:hypothetical protein
VEGSVARVYAVLASTKILRTLFAIIPRGRLPIDRFSSLHLWDIGRGVTKQRSTEVGFSLIEVLAALLVTMLLVLTLTPFVSQMLATWARGGEAANIVEIKTRGVGRLREDLHHAIFWAGYGRRQDFAAFQGDETSMSFPSVTGLGPAGNGIEYLSITVTNTFDGHALVRRRAPVIESTYGNFVDPVVLFSGPFTYVFRYYTREGTATVAWGKGRLDVPARIEVDIVDRSGRTVLGLPISISTFASFSAGCLAARDLQGCPVDPTVDDQRLKMLGLVN